jgi:type IV pilus assembly protein PilM
VRCKLAERILGIDIGSFAVKFVEVEFKGSPPKLMKLGQKTLPRGTVVSGEVVDVEAVASTLKALLASADVRTKRCVVGLGGSRVVVRSLLNPEMTDAELRDAIAFQVIESLPIPASELVSDFERLGTVSVDGNSFVRVLLAGAHESVVGASLEAVRRAGLHVVGVDVNALCSARALKRITDDMSKEPSVESSPTVDASSFAIIEVGSDVTDIVLSSSNEVRFVRTLQVGGGEITRRIQEVASCDEATAEWYKRGGHLEEKQIDASLRDGVSRVIDEEVTRLTQEVANSLEYYLLQSDDLNIEKVFLGGGGGLIKGLDEQLRNRLSVEVELVPASPYFDMICDASVSESDRKLLSLSGLTALGLALWKAGDQKEKRINLIPKKTVYRESIKREVSVFALVFAVLAGGLGLLSFRQTQALSANNAEIDGLNAQSANLQAKIGGYREVAKLSSIVQGLKSQVGTDLEGSISWATVISQIASVTPSDSWWTQLQTSQAAIGAPASLTFSLTGCSQQSPKNWLLALSDLSFVQNEWVSSSNLAPAFASGQACPGYSGGSGQGLENGVTTFSSTATLPQGFSSNRASVYLSTVVNG